MKINKFLLLVTLVFVLLSANAQENKIWFGDLLTENLDDFFAGKYTEVQGEITIENFSKKDVNVLQTLKKCTGNIVIEKNKNLESLKGLENLQVVGGKIIIKNNPELYRFCSLQIKLLNDGIKGEEISKGIIEKIDIERNGYNPSIMNLQHKDCYTHKMEDFCFSC